MVIFTVAVIIRIVSIKWVLNNRPFFYIIQFSNDGGVQEIARREIGKKYLRDRERLEAEYKVRRNKLTRIEESEIFREKKI